jgi:proteic killer suppression protein
MIIHFTQAFQKKAQKLCKKDNSLREDLAKQISIFQVNPHHPSLRLHKLHGRRSEQYAIWIKGDLRALSIKNGNVYIFFELVTHDQY